MEEKVYCSECYHCGYLDENSCSHSSNLIHSDSPYGAVQCKLTLKEKNENHDCKDFFRKKNTYCETEYKVRDFEEFMGNIRLKDLVPDEFKLVRDIFQALGLYMKYINKKLEKNDE